MNVNELGRWGEEQAAEYLSKRGYAILDRNFSCRRGEIDVIAQKGRFVVFVEVKLRKNASFAQAREFVTRAKQQRIIAAAAMWLVKSRSQLQPRFDVIEVYASQGIGGPVRIEHIEDAFQ